MSVTSNIGIKLSIDGAAQAEASLRRVGGSMEQLGSAANGIKSALGGLAGAFAGALSVREFVQAADAVTQLQNNLRLATGSAQAAGQAYGALFDIAQRSRTNFAELGNTFASITRATESLGLSQRQVLALTETIGNAITVSGASAQASQAALVQLGQGLASGVLRGEELNSILEQTPRLAKALADGLGVSTGALRQLGQEGKLTAEAVVGALRSQQGVLASEVQSSVATVSQAFQVLQNVAVKTVGDFDKSSGASRALADALLSIAKGVDTVGKAFTENESTIKTTLGVLAVPATAAALVKTAGLFTTVAGGIGGIAAAVGGLRVAVAALNPVTLALLGIGSVVGGAVAYSASKANDIDHMVAKLKELEAIQARGSKTIYGGESTPEQIKARVAEIERLRAAIGAYNDEKVKSSLIGSGGNAERELRAANEKLALSYDAIRLRLSGFRGDYAQYQSDLQTIRKGMESGAISEKAGIAMLTELAKKHGEVASASTKRSAAETAAERELAAQRKQGFDVVALRNKLVEEFDEQQKKSQALALANSRAYTDTLDKQAQAAFQAVEAAQFQLDTYGLSQTAIARLTLAKLEDARAQALLSALTLDDVRAIDAQIAAQKRLVSIANSTDVLDAQTQGAKAAAKEWKQVGQALTDSLMQGGKSAAEYLKGLFRTFTLRPIISAVVNPVAGALAGGLGLSGTASAATSGVGALSSIGAVSAAFGGGTAAGFGALIGGGFTEAVSAGFTTLLTGGSVGTAAAGLGTLVGALGPVAAVVGLLASLDKSGTYHTGGASSYSAALGGSNIDATTLGTAAVVNSSQTQAMTASMVQSIVGLLDSTAMTFGKSAGYQAATAFADDSSKDGAWGALVISKGGQTLLDWAATQTDRWAPKTFADGETGAKEYAAAVASDVRNLLIEQTPDWADTMLRALGDAPSIEQLAATVQQINATQAALVGMGRASEAFAAMGEQAAATLVAAMGGAEAAASSLAAYYANFYSESERTALSTAQLTEQLATLGVAMPATREAFRALVDDTVASGNTALAGQLLTLSNAFAAVVPAAEAAGNAMAKLKADMAGSYADAYTEYADSVRATSALAAEQASAVQQMAQAYADAMTDAQGYVTSVARNIRQYLDGLAASQPGAGGYGSASAAFSAQLSLARGGDRDALDGITAYADRLLGAINSESTTAAEAALRSGRVRGQLAALPSQISPEQFIAAAVAQSSKDTVAAIDALKANALTTELTVTARSEILKTIQYVADTDRLPDELKQLALDTTSDLRKTISYVVGADLPDDVKQLALLGTSAVSKTIVLVAESTLTPTLQTLALQETQTVGKTIDLVARSALTPEQQALALAQASEATKTIQLVATSAMPDDLKALALQLSGTATKTLSLIATSTLTADQAQLALMGNEAASKTIVLAASSALTEEQKRLAFAASESVQKTIGIVAASTLTDEQRALALQQTQAVAKSIQIAVNSTGLLDQDRTLALQGTTNVAKTLTLAANNYLNPTDLFLALKTSDSITRSVNLAVGRLDGSALAVLNAQSDLVRRTIEASGGVLTDDQRALLTTSDSISKMIELGVDRTQLDAMFSALRSLPPITIPFVGTFNVGSVLEHSANGGNANLDRLASINAYVNTLDWAGNKIAATQALHQTALAYGVNQADIAAATGYSLADIRALFDAAGIPAFAKGGMHSGGLRLVGENGPELEVTGPARYLNNADTASLLRSGGANQAEVLAELRAMREDNQAQARAIVGLQQRLVKLNERWDANGLPETRVEA